MTPLFVEETGAGPPVLFLHSSGLSGRQFRRLAAVVAGRGFRAVVPDLAGHGRSAPIVEPEAFHFHQDVEAVAELVRAYAPVALVGHSYGGLVALQAALAVPDGVRSIVVHEPVAFGVLDSVVHAAELAELGRVGFRWGTTDADRERWLRGFVEYWGGAGAWEALSEELRGEFRRVGWAVREGVRTLMEDRTAAAAYRVISAATTIVTGERSPIAAGAVARVLAGMMIGGRIVAIEGAGHMAPLTHADRFHAIVLEVLGS